MQALRELTNTLGAAGDAPSAACYPATVLSLRACGPRLSLDDFDINKKPLGQGMFGKVYKARHRLTKRVVVIKVIEKAAILREEVKPQLQREIEVHCRLTHPNIIRMYAYFQDAQRGACSSRRANRPWGGSGGRMQVARAYRSYCLGRLELRSARCASHPSPPCHPPHSLHRLGDGEQGHAVREAAECPRQGAPRARGSGVCEAAVQVR